MCFPASTKKFWNTFTCASIFIWEMHKCAPINVHVYVWKIKYVTSFPAFISGFLNSLMLLQTITGDHSPIICGTCTYLYNIKDTIRASWFDWFNRAKIFYFYSMNGKKIYQRTTKNLVTCTSQHRYVSKEKEKRDPPQWKGSPSKCRPCYLINVRPTSPSLGECLLLTGLIVTQLSL